MTTPLGDSDVINSQLQSFFLRNNSVEPARTQMDDLRIGTTWGDVTPVIPEPSTAALIGLGILGATLIRRRD